MLGEKEVRRALRAVKDPELGLDLVVLGLVYRIEIDASHVQVTISLTSPGCPVAAQIVEEVRARLLEIPDVESADVQLTFEPRWTPARMDPIVRASLGL